MTETKKKRRHMTGKGPDDLPLEDYDVSQPDIYQQMTFAGFFEKMRKEEPIHYCKDSSYGPYWSITKFKDIMDVEAKTDIFSSYPTISIVDFKDDVQFEAFIGMDDPKHAEQRKMG